QQFARSQLSRLAVPSASCSRLRSGTTGAFALVTDLLKPSEVARMLQVSRTWLCDAAKDGRIASVRLGGPEGPVRFGEEDIEQWLWSAPGGVAPGGEQRVSEGG